MQFFPPAAGEGRLRKSYALSQFAERMWICCSQVAEALLLHQLKGPPLFFGALSRERAARRSVVRDPLSKVYFICSVDVFEGRVRSFDFCKMPLRAECVTRRGSSATQHVCVIVELYHCSCCVAIVFLPVGGVAHTDERIISHHV